MFHRGIFEGWLVDLLVWMCEQADSPGEKSHLDYFVVSLQLELLDLLIVKNSGLAIPTLRCIRVLSFS